MCVNIANKRGRSRRTRTLRCNSERPRRPSNLSSKRISGASEHTGETTYRRKRPRQTARDRYKEIRTTERAKSRRTRAAG